MIHELTFEQLRQVRNWLVARYLRDPFPDLHPESLQDSSGDPYRQRKGYVYVVYERFELFADFLVGIGVDVLTMLRDCKLLKWLREIPVFRDNGDGEHHEAGIQNLNLPVGRHRVIQIQSWVLIPLQGEEPTSKTHPAIRDAVAKKPRMTAEAANNKAMELAKDNPRFIHGVQRQWAAAIGCSTGQITNLPFWQAVAKETGRTRKGKRPRAVTLTEKVLATEADRDTELERLTAEQRADRTTRTIRKKV